MKPEINVAYCASDNYIHYCMVSIKSLIVNNNKYKINIFILTDYISKKSSKLLKKTIKHDNNVSLEIIVINDDIIKHLNIGIWTKYTWYRILIPYYINSVKRILYLDVDTVITDDISELFLLDMYNRSIASSLDIQAFKENDKENYICAGILLMNLNYWKMNNLSDRIIEWANKNDKLLKYPDQDAINHICNNSKIILPIRYGCMNHFYEYNILNEEIKDQILESLRRPAIIHYVGFGNLPWFIEHSKHQLHNYWIKYNRMLKHPVKRKYETRGINKLKVIIWRAFQNFGIKNI